jgi:hypothetical protein
MEPGGRQSSGSEDDEPIPIGEPTGDPCAEIAALLPIANIM